MPGDTVIIINKAIEIEQALDFDLWATLIGSDIVISGKPTTFFLAYGNKSNNDAQGVPLYIAFSHGHISIDPDVPLYHLDNYDYDSINDVFNASNGFVDTTVALSQGL